MIWFNEEYGVNIGLDEYSLATPAIWGCVSVGT